MGREARDAIKRATVVLLRILGCIGKPQGQRIIQLQVSKLLSLRILLLSRLKWHQKPLWLIMPFLKDRNYPGPWDTGAQEPKGVLGLDTSTVSGPLLDIVCNPNSLTLGFSVIRIHWNCLEGG